MKIKTITIEGMHNVAEKTYTFNNLNYLYGANGAGKSTVLQAIQFALLGYIPGVAKKNEAIFQHAKSNALTVKCTLDDNGKQIVISRSLVKTGNTVTKGLDIQPEGFKIEDIIADIELPVYNFSEFLGLTANNMKNWFINFLPNADADLDWSSELTKALDGLKVIDAQLIPTTLDYLGTIKASGADAVREANAYFKEQTSFMKGNLDRINGTIQSLIYYDDCDSSMSVDELKTEIDKLNSYLSKAAKIESVRDMNKRIADQIASIHVLGTSIDNDERYAQIQQAVKDNNKMIEKFEADLKEISAKKSVIDQKIADLKMDINSKAAVTSGEGICPYTNAECESVKEFIAKLDEEIKHSTSEISKHSAELDELCSAYKNTSLALESAKATLKANLAEAGQIASNYKELERLSSQIQMEELIEGQEVSCREIQEKLASATDTLAKVAANEKYTQLTDNLTAEKFQIENTIEVLKRWTKLTDANGLQTTIMLNPFEELASDMDHYLHKMFGRSDISVKFNLSTKANSFSFGLERDGKYISFEMLSSGEKCMYTLSLMVCLVQRSECPLKLILIDDLLDHLDDDNISTLFEAMRAVENVQFILAGVKDCTNSFKDEVVIKIE